MTTAAARLAAAPGVSINLLVEDEGWRNVDLGDPERFVRRCVHAACEAAGLTDAVETELGVTLADDAAVRLLNRQWRGVDRPTNVLSFPIRALGAGDRPGPMLGDLVLARETLVAEAERDGKTFADHCAHLVVHGTLHCLGYDHAESDAADAMEALEVAILASLGVADPYDDAQTQKEPARA